MKEIAVLLTVFNRREKTLECLERLYGQEAVEGVRFEVYLVNDGCTDGTPEAVREQYPEVHVIDGDGNLYWNRGMYTAWKAAAEAKDYDYYLWLNDDTYLKPDTIRVLVETSHKREDRSVIIGTTCATDDETRLTYGGRIKGKGIVVPNDNLQECELINGNIVLIPRYVFKKVGFNDPYFHHAIGDIDYGCRVREAGLKNFVAPKVLGTCDLHEDVGTCCDSTKPLSTRWKALRKPNGIQPEQFFVYEHRHHGLLIASFHYLTTHLHCLCPWIWESFRKPQK